MRWMDWAFGEVSHIDSYCTVLYFIALDLGIYSNSRDITYAITNFKLYMNLCQNTQW
jgi:hypothetical protein